MALRLHLMTGVYRTTAHLKVSIFSGKSHLIFYRVENRRGILTERNDHLVICWPQLKIYGILPIFPKDKQLAPIRAKNDMPKYQVVMKGYFRIPNKNAFSNIRQENGRVVKGSGIMGFELDPQQCLEEAAGDLRAMGCSIFFKKCQEVDTVSNFVFLGVPNLISEDTVKDTVDEVLKKLENELIQDDNDYKLTVRQKEQWIKYAITKEYPGGMPWEDQAEKKKKVQTASNSRLAFVFHVHRPDEQRLANLLEIAKYRN